MKPPSFLARRTLGPPNYFFIAMAAAFVVGLIPYGAWRALQRGDYGPRGWLSHRSAPLSDWEWFRSQFGGDQFIAVSWDACTLASDEPLQSLARRLRGDGLVAAAELAGAEELFARIVTGRDMIERLTAPPLALSRAEAVSRLEGILVGPVPRAARGAAGGDDSRPTALVAFLTPKAARDGRLTAAAVDAIVQTATEQCGAPVGSVRLGGPLVAGVAIAETALQGLVRWGGAAVAASLLLGYLGWRSWKLAGLACGMALVSAGLSLALVFYSGALEEIGLEFAAPWWGVADALTMHMPAVAYATAWMAAAMVLNYYLVARRERGADGAAETAVRAAWWPLAAAATITAACLTPLAALELAPVARFSLFTAAAIAGSVVLLLAIAPAVLHRFPGNELRGVPALPAAEGERASAWSTRLLQPLLANSGTTALVTAAAMIVLAAGLTRLDITFEPLAVLDRDARLIEDYAWFERRLGGQLAPGVVLTTPPERLRSSDESADGDGQQYRMTLGERLEFVRAVEARLASVPGVTGTLSAGSVTGTPRVHGNSASGDAAEADGDALRSALVEADLLQQERNPRTGALTGRELWQVVLRLRAIDDGRVAVDYDAVMVHLRRAVEPVLRVYEQRDAIVRQLSASGKRLADARIAVLFRGPAPAPDADSAERRLGELLLRSGVASGGVTYVNLATVDLAALAPASEGETPVSLTKQDLIVAASPLDAPLERQTADGLPAIDLTRLPTVEESAAVNLVAEPGARPLRALFAGLPPLMEGVERQTASAVAASVWKIALGAAIGLMAFLWRPVGGLLAALPALLPAAAALGALGWLSVRVDVGTLLAGVVGLSGGLLGSLQYLSWYRRASAAGYTRQEAALVAGERCTPPLLLAAVAVGLGLSVLAASDFSPLKSLSYLGVAQLGLVLVGQAVLSPALVAGPLGRYFSDVVEIGEETDDAEPARPAAWNGERERTAAGPAGPVRIDPPAGPRRPNLEPLGSPGEPAPGALHERLKQLRRRAGDSPSS